MGRGPGQWWSGRNDAPSWTSGTLSLIITAALFTAAFVSMTTVRFAPFDASTRDIDPPVVVHFVPPATVAASPARAEPAEAPAVAPTRVPANIPLAPATIDRVNVPAGAIVPARPRLTRDTAAIGGQASANAANPALRQLGPVREVPTFPPGGERRLAAPIAPAGVTGHGAPISAATRDSISTAKMLGFAEAARRFKPTATQLEAVRRQQEPGLPQYGRAARLPGQAVSVPLMNGGHSVAVFPIFSIPLPNYDRRKAQALDAEYQLRLRRLQDRARVLRDSLRADSLKRDSLLRRIRP